MESKLNFPVLELNGASTCRLLCGAALVLVVAVGAMMAAGSALPGEKGAAQPETAAAAGSQAPPGGAAAERNERKRSDLVDVVAECGLPTDGVTDALPAMNACIAANPGRHLFFPKLNDAAHIPMGGSGRPDKCDYFFSDGWNPLEGNGTRVTGALSTGWVGAGVHLCWDRLKRVLTRPGISISPKCFGCEIGNLYLDFANMATCWITGHAHIPAPGPILGKPDRSGVGFGPDGILLAGGEPMAHDVMTYCAGRNGVAIDGGSWSFPSAAWGILAAGRVEADERDHLRVRRIRHCRPGGRFKRRHGR